MFFLSESPPRVSSLTILLLRETMTFLGKFVSLEKFQNWHRYDLNPKKKKKETDVPWTFFNFHNSNTCRKNFHRIPYYSARNTRRNIDLLHFYSILPFYFDRSRSWRTTSLDG